MRQTREVSGCDDGSFPTLALPVCSAVDSFSGGSAAPLLSLPSHTPWPWLYFHSATNKMKLAAWEEGGKISFTLPSLCLFPDTSAPSYEPKCIKLQLLVKRKQLKAKGSNTANTEASVLVPEDDTGPRLQKHLSDWEKKHQILNRNRESSFFLETVRTLQLCYPPNSRQTKLPTSSWTKGNIKQRRVLLRSWWSPKNELEGK